MEMEPVLFLCFSAFLYFSSEDFRKNALSFAESLDKQVSL